MDEDTITINFKALWQVLLKEKWIIIGITTLFTIAGGIYAFSLKEEYKSEGKILPEVQSKSGSMGQFAGLAALAGVDLASAGGGADAIGPYLYPDVLKTTPYFLNLLQGKFKDKNEKQTIFKSFFEREILDGKVKKNDQKPKYALSNQYTVLDQETENAINDLKQRIICTYDKKTDIIAISVKMPDPVVAAGVAKFSMNYLTDYIINYRIEKQKRDLDFFSEKLNAAKGKYFSNQSKKASYTDKMPLAALRLQSADLQRERIETEYKISSTLYNSLLLKYEEAYIKMQQETPVIKVLEPPVVPNNKSEPKKSIVILIFLTIGTLISYFFAILKSKNYKLIFSK